MDSEELGTFDEDVRRDARFRGERLGFDVMDQFEPFDRVHRRLLQPVNVVLKRKDKVQCLHLHVDAAVHTEGRQIE